MTLICVCVCECVQVHTDAHTLQRNGEGREHILEEQWQKDTERWRGEGLIYGGKIYKGQLLGQRAHFFTVVPF